MGLDIILTLVCILAVLVMIAVILMKKRTAYLGPVKEELQKEKAWLRRGEYNAAMVKGRQNLELLLKLVAEKNGIQLDNSAQAVANAREEEERQSQNNRRPHRGREKTKKIMTHHQFNRWLSENGYLDRVARWEMNQVRLIGNKAVHENYADKDDAWNQFNYLEDILKTITEKSQNPKKHHERKDAEKRENGRQANQNVHVKQAPEMQEQRKKRRKKKKSVKPVKTENQSAEKKLTENKQEEPAPIAEVNDPAKKKRRRRKKKLQSSNAPVEVVVAEPKAETEAVEVVKKKRRRRKKKTQENTVPVEQQVKQTPIVEKTSAESKANEEHAEAKKKPYRRRRRRPRAKTESAAGNAVVPENKNENN